MFQTIKSKVAAAGVGLLILSAAMGGCGIWAFNRLAAEMAQSARVSGLLRDHMQADMMHDAMRGDVLAAILSHDPGWESALTKLSRTRSNTPRHSMPP